MVCSCIFSVSKKEDFTTFEQKPGNEETSGRCWAPNNIPEVKYTGTVTASPGDSDKHNETA